MSGDNGFRYPVDVRFFEVDSLGVVFNMWYLGWCDEAMSAYLEHLGHGYRTLRESGHDAVLRRAELDWVDSLQAFESAQVRVRVEHIGSTSFRLGYDIERTTPGEQDGQSCAHVSITYVCVSVADRAKAPIPLGLRTALEQDRSGQGVDPAVPARPTCG